MRNFAVQNEKDMKCRFIHIGLMGMAMLSCERLDNDPRDHVTDETDSISVSLDEVAEILSAIPFQTVHMQEVHDAVISSSENGYDEEYMMSDLFSSPGSGVGENEQTRASARYQVPVRDLISEYVKSLYATKSEGGDDVAEKFLRALENSDVQIYWPYSENWDGNTMPIVTFDPGDGSDVNTGYEIIIDDDGVRRIEEVVVDEDVARKRPVWVVNRNSDSAFTSLEMMRREDPAWGEGGGNIIIGFPSDRTKGPAALRSLSLKDFTMKRNYDSWFAGASEFFVKVGAVEDFTAATEAELQLYDPTVTDFMIVVKRNQVGIPQPFNAVLVSEWTDQLVNCAVMITEDDGGTMTQWDCSAVVKVNSKSYGFDISIPFRRRDDIVWRGQLSRRWIEANSNLVGRFGDLDLTLEVLEYQD